MNNSTLVNNNLIISHRPTHTPVVVGKIDLSQFEKKSKKSQEIKCSQVPAEVKEQKKKNYRDRFARRVISPETIKLLRRAVAQ